MEPWSIIALAVTAFALWWTHAPDEPKQAAAHQPKQGVGYDIDNLIDSKKGLKAI